MGGPSSGVPMQGRRQPRAAPPGHALPSSLSKGAQPSSSPGLWLPPNLPSTHGALSPVCSAISPVETLGVSAGRWATLPSRRGQQRLKTRSAFLLQAALLTTPTTTGLVCLPGYFFAPVDESVSLSSRIRALGSKKKNLTGDNLLPAEGTV